MSLKVRSAIYKNNELLMKSQKHFTAKNDHNNISENCLILLQHIWNHHGKCIQKVQTCLELVC